MFANSRHIRLQGLVLGFVLIGAAALGGLNAGCDQKVAQVTGSSASAAAGAKDNDKSRDRSWPINYWRR